MEAGGGGKVSARMCGPRVGGVRQVGGRWRCGREVLWHGGGGKVGGDRGPGVSDVVVWRRGVATRLPDLQPHPLREGPQILLATHLALAHLQEFVRMCASDLHVHVIQGIPPVKV